MTKPCDHNDLPNDGLLDLNELPADDNELGQLLGRSLAERVAGPEPIPASAQVYELAARTQRRQRIAGVAAGALLVVGIAGVGISQLGNSEPQDVTTVASTPEPEPTAIDENDNDDDDSSNDEASGTDNSTSDLEVVTTDLPDPADFSDGPALNWTEVDLPDGLGFGRVVGHTDTGQVVLASEPSHLELDTEPDPTTLWLTSDGTDWESLDDVPQLSFVQQAVRSGDVWYVVGEAISATPENFEVGGTVAFGTDPSVFVSRDNGQTWLQVVLQTAEPASASSYVRNQIGGIEIAVHRGQAVVKGSVYADFDFDRYARDNNLIPEGKVVVGSGFNGDSVELFVTVPESRPLSGPDDMEMIVIPVADLGIDDLESIMNGVGNDTLWHLSANGTTNVVLSVPGDGRLASNGRSFLYVNSFERVNTWSSPDGTNWTAQQSTSGDEFFSDIAALGENMLRVANGSTGSVIEVSADDGATWTTLRQFDQLSTARLSVNGVGLATTAFVNAGGAVSGGSLPGGFQVARDGFVFIVDETGMAGELQTDDGLVIRTFDEEAMASEENPPDGIIFDDESGDLSFLDPATNEVLVVFTNEDFEEAMEEIAVSYDATSEVGLPTQWVGWSADGSQWNWIDPSDEFGTGPAAWVETATTDQAVVVIVHDMVEDGFNGTMKIFVGTP